MGPERGGQVGRARTDVHYAALDDDTKALEVLLAGGADPNAADEQGATPLHCAAHVGALDALSLLLAAGAEPDPADAQGNTPLTIAVTASNGASQLVRALLGAGADPERPNKFDRSPAEMARLLGHTEQGLLFADAARRRHYDRRRRSRPS